MERHEFVEEGRTDKCLMNAICNFQQKIYKDYAYDDDGDDEESVM